MKLNSLSTRETPNEAGYRIATLWRIGRNLKGRVWATRGALER